MKKTTPDFSFLNAKMTISNWNALDYAIEQKLHGIDLNKKVLDFKHLLFNEDNAERIKDFGNIFHKYCISNNQ